METQGNAYVKTMNELSDQIGERLGSISRANLTIKSGMGKLPEQLSSTFSTLLNDVKDGFESSVSKSTLSVTKCLQDCFNVSAQKKNGKENKEQVNGLYA
jgi:hypothetical protein